MDLIECEYHYESNSILYCAWKILEIYADLVKKIIQHADEDWNDMKRVFDDEGYDWWSNFDYKALFFVEIKILKSVKKFKASNQHKDAWVMRVAAAYENYQKYYFKSSNWPRRNN